MFSFLSGLSGRNSKTDLTKNSQPTFKPTLEDLEDRRVLSASIIGGNLVINQSPFADSAVVTESTPIIFTQVSALSAAPRSNLRIFPFSFVNVQETINGVVQPLKSFNAS